MNELARPYFRFIAVVVGTALAVRISWLLIRPLLPVITVVLITVAIWQLYRWYRER